VQDFESLRQSASSLSKKMLPPAVLDDFHFVPASTQHIHVRACDGLQKLQLIMSVRR